MFVHQLARNIMYFDIYLGVVKLLLVKVDCIVILKETKTEFSKFQELLLNHAGPKHDQILWN